MKATLCTLESEEQFITFIIIKLIQKTNLLAVGEWSCASAPLYHYPQMPWIFSMSPHVDVAEYPSNKRDRNLRKCSYCLRLLRLWSQ